MLQKKPEDPIPYMTHILEEMKGIATKPLSPDEREELEKLRHHYKKYKAAAEKDAANNDKEDESGDSSEGEDVGELPEHSLSNSQGRISTGPRISVSAEAYGRWNKKMEFKARVITKTQETKDKIRERLS